MMRLESAVEALANLFYLIEHEAEDPVKVRAFIEMAQQPMRVLTDAVTGRRLLDKPRPPLS